MTIRTFVSFLLLVTLAVPATARERAVVFEWTAGGGEPPANIVLTLKRINRLADADNNTPDRTLTVSTVTAAAVELEAGTWWIQVQHEDWWHAKQFVHVTGNETEPIRIQLWPVGTVTGVIKAEKNRPLPPSITCRFAPAEERVTAPAGDVNAPVVEGRFNCRVPAMSLDLRVRAVGTLARFFWNKNVRPAAATDLGEITLPRGASLVGRVELARGLKDPITAVRVTVSPAGLRFHDQTTEQRRGISSQAVKANEKGWFHFDGIAPGEYTVAASLGPAAALPVQVAIVPDVLAELTQPLRISERHPIALVVQPPLDPSGKRWRVSLDRRVAADEADVITNTLIPPDGIWVSPRLTAATYLLAVGPESGGVWRSEEVDLTGEPVTLNWTLEQRTVSGKVTLGDRPLAAKLTFRERNGAVSAVLDSNKDGEFSGAIPPPRAKEWLVVIEASEPRLKRAFPVKDDESATSLEFEIPLSLVTGVVVQPDGSPAYPAGVNAWAENPNADVKIVQAHTAKDGSFSIAALEPGDYKVQADAFLQESEVADVKVSDSEASAPLRLTLRDQQKIPGRVFSDFGPVAGAEVRLYPTDAPAIGVFSNHTDVKGEFAATVAPGATEIDVFVAPPGFAFRMAHTRIREGGLNLRVEHRGGAITFEEQGGDGYAHLSHNGALFPVSWLLSLPIASRQSLPDGRSRVTLNPMEPGVYALCMLKYNEQAVLRANQQQFSSRCTSGFLPPYGTLDLSRIATSSD